MKMAKSKHNIGREILERLREIKRGEYGRVINIPEVASIREKTGLSQARLPSYSVCRFAVFSRSPDRSLVAV